jgi:predicted ATPase
MKIRKLRLTGFQQFQDTLLDFTHPETGETLSRICLIGRNGTGKSTVLEVIERVCAGISRFDKEYFCSGELEFGGKNIGFLGAHKIGGLLNRVIFFKSEPLYKLDLRKSFDLDKVNWGEEFIQGLLQENRILDQSESPHHTLFQQVGIPNAFFVVSPPYSMEESFNHLPETNLNKALRISQGFSAHHLITAKTVTHFWENLMYALRERDRLREEFENRPENIQKTKKQLIEEFDALNPTVLDGLAEIWNRLLAPAGLEFDAASVRKPVQLHDNLEAYIRLKSTGERIPYNRLSTGIRDFIFRIGHIYSIFFNREVKSGFLLVDEPENSLFPEFLYDLMEIYRLASTDKRGENHTQLFVATHNPIIAAQFEPYERIILDWEADGSVSARRGLAPAGDDPNDVLKKDFELDHLMGAKGIEMWERYLDLRKQLRNTGESHDREAMIAEIQKIGNDYNFLPQ